MININKFVPFNQQQSSVLVGTLLGDANLQTYTGHS
jgi:hypothetical protein